MQLVMDHAGVEEAHELTGPERAGRGGLAEVADVDVPGGPGHQGVLFPDAVQGLIRGRGQ